MGSMLSGIIGCMIEISGMMLLSWKIHNRKPDKPAVTTVMMLLLFLPVAIVVNLNDTSVMGGAALVAGMVIIISYNKLIFNCSIKSALLTTIITMLLTVCIELITGLSIILFNKQIGDSIIISLFVFVLMIIAFILIYCYIPLDKVYALVAEKKFTVAIVFAFYLTVVAYILLTWKVNRFLEIDTLLFLGFFMVALFIVTFEWRKSYAESLKKQKDLEMITFYSNTFDGLVAEIRSRQHEYDNQICALINMHLTIKDYNELVDKQLEYVKQCDLEINGKYITLLKLRDNVLAGFLYSKIVQAMELEIEVELLVYDFETHTGKSESDVISIAGVLIDNAMDACDKEHRHIILTMDSDTEGRMVLGIMNAHEIISPAKLSGFFEKGFTTKTNDKEKHGLGLYHAMRLVQQHEGTLQVENYEFRGENYIRFILSI